MSDPRTPDSRLTTEADAISLVDLLAVLLRWRRLIVFTTLAALSVTIAAYIIVPNYNLAKAQKLRVIDINASLMLGQVFGTVIGEAEGINFLLQSIADPENVLAALRGAGYETVEKIPIGPDADLDEALFMIRRRVLENRGLDGDSLKESNRIFSSKLDKGVLTLVFRNGDPAKGKRFLELLLESVESELREFVMPFAQTSINSYERLLQVKNPSEAVETSKANDYQQYDLAKRFATGSSKSLTILRPPYVLVPIITIEMYRNDWVKKGLVLTFGAFFMSVFVAFVLQYIDSLKRDPQAMTKIKNAIRRER